ncbi:hypothetical protein OS493_028465 [Desmophyllum pertusum]|uniref:Uncharacterized protein n=1 Tax=Desmophyllum pertusum TaxID=174260 RepID=A0A9X0D2J7_9CNID|nr:hypothetical protein OS493_028465 [Desmophyllum pertusum]
MAVMVRTCCCGCDLRTGILLIGIFGLVVNKKQDFVLNLGYVGIGFGAISLVINLLLLASYGARNRYLAYPWVLWSIFELVYNLGVTIFLMPSGMDLPVSLLGVSYLGSYRSISSSSFSHTSRFFAKILQERRLALMAW